MRDTLRSRRLFVGLLLIAVLALGACPQGIREAADAGERDAGDEVDGGEPDAGGRADAGDHEDAGEPEPDAGARCPEVSCTGFTWCEPVSGSCLPGCGNSSQCTGGTCETDHACRCSDGFHLCEGRCADSSSPLTCGERCEPCPAPGGMTATCIEGECAAGCAFPAYPTPSGCSSGLWPGPGVESTCAAVGEGGVRCWGANTYGGLGIGTHGAEAGSPSPVALDELVGPFARVEAGWDGHACALSTSGQVWCWGANPFGEVGDGTRIDKYEPVQVDLSGVVGLDAGVFHTCAVTAAGGVVCWGKNDFGQLGDGRSITPSYVPSTALPPGSGAILVSCGERNCCALKETGGLVCWGTNQSGQLGDGGWNQSDVPVDVPSLTAGVRHVAFGQLHVCAVLEAGGAKCWGYDNECGRLGTGSTSSKRVPTDVLGLPGPAFSVAAGYDFTCALLESGAVYCWGCNDYGQLGNGTTEASGAPLVVTGLDAGVVHLAAGHSHACAVTADGRLLCWGANDTWQMADESGQNALVPVEVQGL